MKKINIFIILISLIFSFLTLYANSTNKILLVEKHNYNLSGFIPVDEPFKSNTIASFGINIDDYYQLGSDSFKPEIFTKLYKKWITFNSTDSINILPGTYTTNILLEAETLNASDPQNITVRLIEYANYIVNASKTNNINPIEYESVVNIVNNTNINELYDYTGSVNFNILNDNSSVFVNFENGIGILDISGINNYKNLYSINIKFTIDDLTQFVSIQKNENGLFETNKILD
jgi:hypothetical protein